MKVSINQSIRNLWRTMNVCSKDLTSKGALQSLLRKLYPVSCDKALIRLGPRGDGGYLVPDDLDGIEACFSPGVGLSSLFEKDCADRRMKIFLADGSVDKTVQTHELFILTKKHVGPITNDKVLTLDDWVQLSLPGSKGDLLLQMDIEGSEYEVISATSDDLLKRFRIIVIEFHDLNELYKKSFYEPALQVFEKILQSHTCVHNHPNNCSGMKKIRGFQIPEVMEFTFLRNDRISSPSYTKTFPHPLDVDNDNNHHALVLPKCWYHSAKN